MEHLYIKKLNPPIFCFIPISNKMSWLADLETRTVCISLCLRNRCSRGCVSGKGGQAAAMCTRCCSPVKINLSLQKWLGTKHGQNLL